MDVLFHDISNHHLHFAYYVGDASLEKTIYATGIPLSADGHVHLFGSLSCAVTKREILESHGIACAIWKVDLSECGKAEIDPTSEEVVAKVAGEKHEFCKGFVVDKPINAGRILSSMSHC